MGKNYFKFFFCFIPSLLCIIIIKTRGVYNYKKLVKRGIGVGFKKYSRPSYVRTVVTYIFFCGAFLSWNDVIESIIWFVKIFLFKKKKFYE